MGFAGILPRRRAIHLLQTLPETVREGTVSMKNSAIIKFAKLVSDYFGSDPIPPYLDGDLALRDGARAILGLDPVRPWKEGDDPGVYEGHRIHCPKCGYECTHEELP